MVLLILMEIYSQNHSIKKSRTSLNNKIGVINWDETLSIPPQYENIQTPNIDESIIALNNNDKYGFINLIDNKIIEPK